MPMNYSVKGDQWMGLVWMLIGFFVILGSLNLGMGELRQPGPGFSPLVWGTLLAGLGVIIILKSRKKEQGEGDAKKEGVEIFSSANRKTLFCSVAIMLGYILLFEPLGFIISTFLFFFSLMKLTRPGQWIIPFLISIASSAGAYLVFSWSLKCQLPEGFWGF